MEDPTPGQAAPGDGSTFREAAASAVVADPALANLLERRSAGEKLSQSEYGKLGAWASKVTNLFRNKTGPAQPAPVVDDAAGSGLANTSVDSDLVKRTTGAVLKSADTIVRRYVTREARKAGADDKAASRFDSAATLPAVTQELITEVSPQLLEALGVDARSYPITVAVASLGLWGTNIYLCIDELKEMQRKNMEAQQLKDAA